MTREERAAIREKQRECIIDLFLENEGKVLSSGDICAHVRNLGIKTSSSYSGGSVYGDIKAIRESFFGNSLISAKSEGGRYLGYCYKKDIPKGNVIEEKADEICTAIEDHVNNFGCISLEDLCDILGVKWKSAQSMDFKLVAKKYYRYGMTIE